jgi:hypothetical protein
MNHQECRVLLITAQHTRRGDAMGIEFAPQFLSEDAVMATVAEVDD